MSAALPPILDTDVIRAQVGDARASALAQLEVFEAAVRGVDDAIKALHTARDTAVAAGRHLEERVDRARRLDGRAPLVLGLDRDLAAFLALPLDSTVPTAVLRFSDLLQHIRAGLADPSPNPKRS